MEAHVTELESELTKHLAPVAAPESLWTHVQRRREPGRGIGWLRALAPLAAALLLIASSAVAWRIGSQRPGDDLRRVAEAQLRGGALDLESSDPAEVRAWVKQRAGVDLPLTWKVRLSGARAVDGRAVIAYEVDGGRAAVAVARGSQGTHPFAYAVASAERTHARSACLLCHT
jgi:hypothetical protein